MWSRNKDVIVIGGAVFAMFFGAGNLIFPPLLGAALGPDWLTGTVGFVLTTAVLSLLAMMAVAKAGDGFADLARHLDKKFSAIFGVVLVLAIGPLLAIPRTGATTYEMGILPVFPEVSANVVSMIYFAGVLLFSISKNGVMDKVGKFLTPTLVVGLLFIICKAVFSSGDVAPLEDPATSPFSKSFVEGYQTLDVIGAVLFTIVTLGALREKNYQGTSIPPMVFKTGLLAATFLAFVYGGLMYMGALGAEYLSGDMARTTFFVTLVEKFVGVSGKYILALTVTMACFSTAVGLTSVTAVYFERLTKGKMSYKFNVIVCSVISYALANLGVESIVALSGPALSLLYPALMVLIGLMLFSHLLPNKEMAFKAGVYSAVGISVCEAISTKAVPALSPIFAGLPFAEHGFGWLVPTLVILVLAIAYSAVRPRKAVV
ncbi:branched-chain amino acid transport system carrier protein [Fulvitalea axinellae]|uniref:Branched-chain amino acid transport system carrier protein n=1 Tax=Fulvitalea axinellae TaxID=1182444 RepID=A0AAU9D4A6_9BACT|nr:branched-chain amino acid transport system carrier protein [Fulvitalea axinellae]